MADPKQPEEMEGALFVEGDAPTSTEDAAEDGKAELAVEMVNEILHHMGLAVDVEIRSDADEVVLDLTGEDAGRVIGRKGQTLDAMQFLVNKIVNRFPEGRRHIVLDSGDYRERHDDGLTSLAMREAKRAVALGRVIALQPMSPRDRRVVHLSLAKMSGVSTESDGEGPDRRVRIIPGRVQTQRSRR